MKTELSVTFLGRILEKMKPSDVLFTENRQAIKARIERLLEENSWSAQQFSARMRPELDTLRTWLSGTKDMTADYLSEVCGLFHLSLGDLLLD